MGVTWDIHSLYYSIDLPTSAENGKNISWQNGIKIYFTDVEVCILTESAKENEKCTMADAGRFKIH